MTKLDVRPLYDSTSAAGSMLHQVRVPLVVGVMLAGMGTSTGAEAYPFRPGSVAVRPVEQTNAGTPVVEARHAGSAIAEVRRLTGLTWDQLARLFNVSRRALHFWASGRAMAPSNEEQLQRLLAVVRKIDRGSADVNRALIFGPREDGTIPFDLLGSSQCERILALLGPGSVQQSRRPPVASEVLAARAPRPPEELVGALQDRVHPASGHLIASKAVRAVRRQ